ncbi:MAG: TolC family protein [Gemmatimonadetes bacterium]|nr:TolC family protein [Gemmatimonadota bacterium]
MTRNSTSVLLALLLAAPAHLHAQEALPRGEPLSLQQALRTAEANNPQYRRALTEIGTAEADVRRARGAFLPELNFGMGTSGGFNRKLTGQTQFGEVIRRDTVLEYSGSSSRQNLSLSGFRLFDGGERRSNLQAARAGEQAVTARVEGEEVRVRAEVTRRYWESVRADRVIRLEEALLASARDRLEVTQALVRVGVRGPLDVLGAEVAVAEQEQALERARGDARKAQLDLRQAMGVIEGGWLRLTDDPPAMFDPAALDTEALVAAALARHPRIQRVDLSVLQADARVRSARAARMPRLSMGATVARTQGYTGYGGLVGVNPLDQQVGLDFSLQLPLFTGYRTSYQIQSARATRDAAAEDARAERLTLEREVRSAVVDLDNAFRTARLAERTLELNRQRLELAQEQYRVGALTLNDLTDAVERAARAERDALRTRFDFATALATLNERAGGPVRP